MEDKKSQSVPFGKLKSGEQAHLYTLTNKNGMKVKITDFGATIVQLYCPNKQKSFTDVILGFPSVEHYESPANQHISCTVGRVCNRTAFAQFKIGQTLYKLDPNCAQVHHLHGGSKRALHLVLWQVVEHKQDQILMKYTSPDGEEGYPGTLQITCNYQITQSNNLMIQYNAKSVDKTTPVNITNHAYWNLSGQGNGKDSLLEHQVQISANYFTPTDQNSIPNGQFKLVKGSVFDFTERKKIGKQIGELVDTDYRGYDHNFVLNKYLGKLQEAATVWCEASGIKMRILTNTPGMQMYTGNFLYGQSGKNGHKYEKHSGLCLEAQFHPNSANIKHFPCIFLEPGETFNSKIIHQFSLF